MTVPVTPPDVIIPSPYPALGSPTFNEDAYATWTTVPGAITRIGEIAENAATNTQISHDNAVTALQAKDLAVTAAEEASASVNFLGFWEDQTGSAAKGVSVKHNNRIWRSVVAIANITLSEPGVSADWTTGDGGVVTQRVAVNTTMSAGVAYTGTASGIVMLAPATLLPGDVLEFMNATAQRSYADFNGHTVKGQTPDSPMSIPPFRGFRLKYDGVTLA